MWGIQLVVPCCGGPTQKIHLPFSLFCRSGRMIHVKELAQHVVQAKHSVVIIQLKCLMQRFGKFLWLKLWWRLKMISHHALNKMSIALLSLHQSLLLQFRYLRNTANHFTEQITSATKNSLKLRNVEPGFLFCKAYNYLRVMWHHLMGN